MSRWNFTDQCALGAIARIATREIEFLRSLKALPFENRANRVLLYIDKRARRSGRPFAEMAPVGQRLDRFSYER